MNVLRRVVVLAHGKALKVLLVLAVLLLVAQLGRPHFLYWWNLPTPGAIGSDQFEATSLADNFAIYLPPSYRSKPAWPLVVFLHGSGERGTDPSVLRESWPMPLNLQAIVAAPQCRPSHSWDSDAVAKFIRDGLSRYHVDPDRIYLVGYSMGAYGTWQTAAAHPQLFAAIVPVSGGGEPSQAKAFVDIPVWAFHGANDNVVPVDASERMIHAIRDAGGQPTLTILPDAGHGICDTICSRLDLWKWLFEQRRVD